MNDIFSLSRFVLLIKKFTKEHLSTYLLYIAALFGIILLVYGLTIIGCLQGRFPGDAPVFYFGAGVIFMAAFFASSFYGFFNNKAKGIQYLNLPASAAEKLTVGFIFTQLIFFVVFIFLFWIADRLMVGFYNHFHKMPAHLLPGEERLYTASPMDFSSNMVTSCLILAFIVSAISHFGSLCYEKNAFVKTALFIIIGGATLVFYNYYSIQGMIPEGVMPGGEFYNKYLRVGSDTKLKGILHLPESWVSFQQWSLPMLPYVLFWAASYFKLKEKQV